MWKNGLKSNDVHDEQILYTPILALVHCTKKC